MQVNVGRPAVAAGLTAVPVGVVVPVVVEVGEGAGKIRPSACVTIARTYL
jgi:hypothetical protein